MNLPITSPNRRRGIDPRSNKSSIQNNEQIFDSTQEAAVPTYHGHERGNRLGRDNHVNGVLYGIFDAMLVKVFLSLRYW
jgi:hypothetical protein